MLAATSSDMSMGVGSMLSVVVRSVVVRYFALEGGLLFIDPNNKTATIISTIIKRKIIVFYAIILYLPNIELDTGSICIS